MLGCVGSPIDVVAYLWDEPRQGEEVRPAGVRVRGEGRYVAVGAAVTLGEARGVRSVEEV